MRRLGHWSLDLLVLAATDLHPTRFKIVASSKLRAPVCVIMPNDNRARFLTIEYPRRIKQELPQARTRSEIHALLDLLASAARARSQRERQLCQMQPHCIGKAEIRNSRQTWNVEHRARRTRAQVGTRSRAGFPNPALPTRGPPVSNSHPCFG